MDTLPPLPEAVDSDPPERVRSAEVCEGQGPAPARAPAVVGIEATLAALRDPATAEAAREEAWGEFVRWFYLEHFAPALEERLRRRIEARGLAAHLSAGEVLTAFCLRVRERPAVLGMRPVPSRAWLRQQLVYVCQELEKPITREESRRLRPRSAEEQSCLLEGSTRDEAAAAVDGSAAFLSSPETVMLLRELETELTRQLARLAAESPNQHRAWVEGSAGARYRDIARGLGAAEGTVKSLIHRARETLKARLAAYLRPSGGKEAR